MKNRLICFIAALACLVSVYLVIYCVEWSRETKGIVLYIVMCVCVYTVYAISQIAKDEERTATQEWLDRFGGE